MMFVSGSPVQRAAATASALALLSGAVAAQTPNQTAQARLQIEEIVVTAQKREQSLREVPITITAFSGDFLNTIGANDLEAIARYVPGLEIQEQSPNNPGFVIRGITSDSGESFSEPRVSVFFNGVDISKSRGSYIEPFDLERVEVLKGPQGTLFGRGAQIGAVHILSHRAEQDFNGALKVGIGNYDAWSLRGHLNAPVIKDVLAARIAFTASHRDGFLENLADGSALNGKGTDALRGSLRYTPNEALTIDVIGYYQHDDYPGTSFKSRALPTFGSTTAFFTAANLNRGRDLFIKRDVFGLQANIQYRFAENWTVTSLTGWHRFDSLEEFDADGSALYLLEFAEDAEADQFSQELRVNYDSGRFAGFVAANYFYNNGSQRVPFRTDERQLAAFFFARPQVFLPNGVPNTGFTVNPGAPLPALAGRPLRSFYEETATNFGTTKSFDLVADGTFDVTESLQVLAGIRGTWEDLTSGRQADLVGSNLPLLGGAPNLLYRPMPVKETTSENYSSWVGRVGLRYAIGDTASVYATVARGRRPPVISYALTSGVRTFLKNELVTSYEAGFKAGLFDNRLSVEGAGFYYEYRNFQTNVNIDGIATPIDAGNATAKGVEGSVFFSPIDRLTVFATYGYTDATFDDTDSQGRPQIFAGQTFRLMPKHKLAIGADFRAPISDTIVAFLTPTFNWKSEAFFENNVNPAVLRGVRQGGYGLFNLRAGVSFDEGRFEIAASAENLFNRKYLIDAGNTGGAFGIPTYIAGPPRFYGIEASAKF
jgi:outer membrane receptor protein involved in Fe transport